MTAASPKEPLAFQTDKGSRTPLVLAIALVVALVGWMGSGFILPAEEEEVAAEPNAPRLVTVAVIRSTASEVANVFQAEGQAEPDRDSALRAEMTGEVAEVLVRKGDTVEDGQLIARIDPADRTAALTRASEELNRATSDLQNAETLLERGSATQDRVRDARATLAAAEAAVASAEASISDTEIRAPFAGLIDDLEIDAGEYVTAGSEIGYLVDSSPLSIAIRVPQQMRAQLRVGSMADVGFITGEQRMGTLTFVSATADPQTRTFLAEVEVPNDDNAVPAGISAEVRMVTGESTAHFISPAILSLDTNGTLGIKVIEAENRVAFHEVTIIRAQTDGIWVTGLDDEAQIITVGQGFVTDGQVVNPSFETEQAQ